MEKYMKKFLVATIVLCGALAALVIIPAMAGSVGSDCSFNGKKLYGKVQVVTSFPDIKVQVVSSFPDLTVQKVTSFPDSCGKWEFTESIPDLKIQFVDSFPDVKIEYVTSFPGLP